MERGRGYFHQTSWFYGLCAASVLLLAGGAFRLRVRRLETREWELSALVAVRTEALTIAQDQLKEWNRTLEGRVQEATLAVKESERMAAYGHMVAGVAADHLSRLFEPFYTTGRGSGLGLAIVRRIVQDHGGTIDVESKPEGGTVFTIVLPGRGPA